MSYRMEEGDDGIESLRGKQESCCRAVYKIIIVLNALLKITFSFQSYNSATS